MSLGYIDSQSFTDIADAIREKNGSSDTYTPSQMPQAILDIPTGGGEIEPGDITFYDWDGTILYKYSLEEAHQLTSLPALPADYKDYHADSWTETLATLQTTNVPMNVGINYTTTRQTNRFFITIEDDRRLEVSVEFDQNSEIDWGDGTTSSASNGRTLHTYQHPGDYVIETNCMAFGTGNSFSPVIYSPGDFTPSKDVTGSNLLNYNSTLLRWVELGDGGVAGKSNYTDPGVFCSCWNLTKILIPTTGGLYYPPGQFTNGGGLKFSGIRFLSLPSTSSSPIGNLTLAFLPFLERFVFPSNRMAGMQTNSYFFRYDYAVKDILMYWNGGSINSSIIASDIRNIERIAVKNATSIGINLTYGTKFKGIWLEEGLTTCTGFNIQFTPFWKSITFPSTLTTMDTTSTVTLTFNEVHFKSITPPTWSSGIPTNLRCQRIYVPAESVEDYKTAWPTYESIIQAEPTP